MDIIRTVWALLTTPPALHMAKQKKRLEATCRACGLSRSHAQEIVAKYFAKEIFE